MLVFRGVCPDHPPVQKGHPKLLISKAALDGIVAREMFFRTVSWVKRLRFMKPSITGRNLGGLYPKWRFKYLRKKPIVFLVSFYSPFKVFCSVFFIPGHFFLGGGLTFSISNGWKCWQLGSLSNQQQLTGHWILASKTSPKPNRDKKRRLGPFFASYFLLEEESKVQNRDWGGLNIFMFDSPSQMGSVAVKLPPVAGDRFFKKFLYSCLFADFWSWAKIDFSKKNIRVMAEKKPSPSHHWGPNSCGQENITCICFKGFTKLQALLGNFRWPFCGFLLINQITLDVFFWRNLTPTNQPTNQPTVFQRLWKVGWLVGYVYGQSTYPHVRYPHDK